MTMTKITPSVRSTIREVLEKHHMPASTEMRMVATRVVRESLREDHGIAIRMKTLLRIADRVA
jgi:hypothetical protein